MVVDGFRSFHVLVTTSMKKIYFVPFKHGTFGNFIDKISSETAYFRTNLTAGFFPRSLFVVRFDFWVSWNSKLAEVLFVISGYQIA